MMTPVNIEMLTQCRIDDVPLVRDVRALGVVVRVPVVPAEDGRTRDDRTHQPDHADHNEGQTHAPFHGIRQGSGDGKVPGVGRQGSSKKEDNTGYRQMG